MATVSLSERQQELLKAVCEVMKTDIDWTKVAELANFKTPKYARDQWALLRNKIVVGGKAGSGGGNDADDDGGSTGKGKKATPKKRKTANNDDGDNDESASPKKPKATPRKRKATPASGTAAEDDDKPADGVVKNEPDAEDDS